MDTTYSVMIETAEQAARPLGDNAFTHRFTPVDVKAGKSRRVTLKYKSDH